MYLGTCLSIIYAHCLPWAWVCDMHATALPMQTYTSLMRNVHAHAVYPAAAAAGTWGADVRLPSAIICRWLTTSMGTTIVCVTQEAVAPATKLATPAAWASVLVNLEAIDELPERAASSVVKYTWKPMTTGSDVPLSSYPRKITKLDRGWWLICNSVPHRWLLVARDCTAMTFAVSTL